MDSVIAYLDGFHWSLPIAFVVGGLILIHLGINFLYKILYPRYAQKAKHLPLFLLNVLYHPFKLFMWLLGFSFLLTLYAGRLFQLGIGSGIRGLLQVGIVFAFAWTLYIFSKEGERVLLEKWHQDLTTVALFSKVCFLIVALASILLILPILGIPIGGLLAFGGLGGIVVGFAAKDALSNIFGGMVLAIDRPFKIGEWILTPDGKMEGCVEAIGWRVTKLRTLEKRVLYVPNNLFSSMVYINRTRITHYRVWKMIGLAYEDIDKMPDILHKIRAYISQRHDLDRSEMNFIHLVDLADSALNLELRVYVKTSDYKKYFQAMEEILLEIYLIIKNAGASLAYPTQTLYISKGH
jgi:MscS family membrane protein